MRTSLSDFKTSIMIKRLYNLRRYYEPEADRFVNQNLIGSVGGDNLYSFGNQVLDFIDPLGLKIYGHRKNGTFRKKPGPKSKKKSASKGGCIQNKKDGDAREALHKKIWMPNMGLTVY